MGALLISALVLGPNPTNPTPLHCREAEGVEPNPADPWESREFFVKWARYSYVHCSWDTRATLSQLKGYKRVLNYIRKVEEREVSCC